MIFPPLYVGGGRAVSHQIAVGKSPQASEIANLSTGRSSDASTTNQEVPTVIRAAKKIAEAKHDDCPDIPKVFGCQERRL
jgi:hypothetical protein